MTDNIFGNGARSGLFHLDATQQAELAGRAGAAGLRLRIVDLKACRTIAECLTALGEALTFPDWYGGNLDALVDCLCDADWQSATGDIVLLAGIEGLSRTDRQSTDTLLEALSAASAEARSNGQILWILVDRPLPGAPALPDA